MEADFEFLFESAPYAVLIVSAKGKIVRINSGAERMFGFPRQELLRQPLQALLPYPAAGPMVAAGETLGRHRDGREFLVDVTLNPRTAGGVIAIVRDRRATSEQCVAKQAGQASITESILNSMGEGVIVYDQSGKLLLINQAAVRINSALDAAFKAGEGRSEWGSISAKFGLFLPDKVTPYPTNDLALSRVLRGEIVDSMEMFIRVPDAPEGIWASVTGRPLVDGSGNPAGGVVVVRDTTARKLAQGALLAGQEAERKRVARELHDSVSQEICCLILDITQLQGELPGSPAEICRRLDSQKEKLIDLAEEVDAVCRQLHPSVLERIGLDLALQRLCEEFTKRKSLQTRFTRAGIQPFVPAASALCLYRVAQEGLRNIVRHAHATHATVTLSSGLGGMHLSIADDGVGFDPKAAGAKGRLGLVSMQERVRLVGGSYTIHSEPGHGTRIDLRIPLLDEPHGPKPCETTPAAVAAS